MFENLSLRSKMLIGGILLNLLPILILGYFASNEAAEGIRNESYTKAHQMALQMAKAMDLALAEKLNMAKALSQNDLVRIAAGAATASEGMTRGQIISHLNDYLATIYGKVGQDYESIFFADSKGQITADNVGGKMANINVSDRDYYRAAQGGKGGIGDTIKSRASGKPAAVIYEPVMSDKGGFKGLVGLILRTEVLSKHVSGTKIGKTGYGWMIDRNGFFVAHPNPDNILSLDTKTLNGMEDIIRAMLAGKNGVESYVFKGTPKVCGYAPVTLAGWSIGATQDTEEFMAPVVAIRNGVILIGGIALALSVLVVILFVTRLTHSISYVAEELGSSADQLASASTEIASASQSLAEGASEQAAALEETNSTLTELAASSKDTAHITDGANNLMNHNIAKTAKSLKALKQLTTEMDQIEQDSSQIGNVTKTINDIAFQTNLLALNASVEAARAGDAGAGFAVVAEEVRNLALNAAEAANDSQELLENMRSRIVNGAGSLRDMSQDFEGIVESATTLGEQTYSITEASKEQALGIEQISNAASQMDTMTQRMAANSEESAASAEELAAQTEMMRSMVVTLVGLVYGAGGADTGSKRNRKKTSSSGGLMQKMKMGKSKSGHGSQGAMGMLPPGGGGQEF